MEYFELITDAKTGKVAKRPYEAHEIEAAKAQATVGRIETLKQMLKDTDYIAMPDYDKSKPDVLAQRQAWREEIRLLEGNV